jgi:hypothetical protein
MSLFGVAQLPECLEDLVIPANVIRDSASQELLDAGLVRYRTETGIACQGPEDWDIVLTERGMRVLRLESSEDPAPLA